MLRSMFSAVSGLRSHQTMMDVTGNNVANVNTAGFKSSRTTFQETLTQMTRGGAAGVGNPDNEGGVNPMQIGLGARVAATDLTFTQGAMQATGRPTDLAIQGDGFFRVEVAGEDGERYMRAGAFSFDSAGNLVGPGGELVQDEAGTTVNVDPAAYTEATIGKDGTITARNADGNLESLQQIGMARFPNVGGLEQVGNGLFAESAASGGVINGVPGEEGFGTLEAGALEMSNVDLAQEFTNLILSQRGFQANSRTITTSDELLQELVNLKR